MASIITLRQEVLTGNKQLAASLTVKTWKYDAGMDKVVSMNSWTDERALFLFNNIAGICQLKES
jgi:hypothetical protein